VRGPSEGGGRPRVPRTRDEGLSRQGTRGVFMVQPLARGCDFLPTSVEMEGPEERRRHEIMVPDV
jgi:hypothetical protein